MTGSGYTRSRVFLGELAEVLDLELRGEAGLSISGVATLSRAGPEDASFLANPAYRADLRKTRAGVVLIRADALADCPGPALLSANPYADWARLIALLVPPRQHPAGIHPSAVVDPGARIAPSASIGPLTHIAAGVQIGERVVVGPGCVIDEDVQIGEDAQLIAKVYLGARAHIGKRVICHPGVIIGGDGFGLAMDSGRWRRVPQIGSVRIGDDCEIGANTTIDRGALDDTVLEEDVRVDNQVQIAHNVRIGAHTAIAGCVGIAGSTRIGRYCMIAGASGIGGHLDICDSVIITAMSTVLDSIDQPGEYGSGIPARPHGRWKRLLVRLGQLDDLARRLKRVEQSNNKD